MSNGLQLTVNVGPGVNPCLTQQKLINSIYALQNYSSTYKKLLWDISAFGVTDRVRVLVQVVDDTSMSGALMSPDPAHYGVDPQMFDFVIRIPQHMIDGETYTTNDPAAPLQRVPFELLFSHELGHVYEALAGVPYHTSTQDIEAGVAKDLGLPEAQDWNAAYNEGSGSTPCDNIIFKDVVPKNVAPPSDPARDMNDKKGAAQPKQSPLVLDLDFSGTIDLVSIEDSQARWDLDQDGFAEHTGWVQSQDGFLVRDINQDGIVNGQEELFGLGDVNGFSVLRLLDTNGDGQITREDQNWSELFVWRDLNGNGSTDEGELEALSNYNIVSIDLDATEVSLSNQGNDISHISTFTVDDGLGAQSYAIHDVWFSYDNLNTSYVGAYIPDATTLAMPTLRGYGVVADLSIAMSMDNDRDNEDSLISLVQELQEKTLPHLFDSSANDLILEILFRWAGVDQIDPASRGDFVDARELGFIEKFSGEDFLQRNWSANPLGTNAGEDLNDAFKIIFDHLRAMLISQVAGAQLFSGYLSYNSFYDGLQNFAGLRLDALDDLEEFALALATTSERADFWENVVAFIEHSVGMSALGSGELYALQSAVASSDPMLDWISILASLTDEPVVMNIAGSNGVDDTLNGTSGVDVLSGYSGNDTLYGHGGDDTIVAGDGDDVLVGGEGGDFLQGGYGNDTYVYNDGDGWDTIIDLSGSSDKLVFGLGITESHLNFIRVSNDDLVVQIDNGTNIGNILIQDFFTSGKAVETIEFADASTLSLNAINNWVLTGSGVGEALRGVQYNGGTDDIIYGGGGHDKIYGYAGNDTLHGDGGDDTLYGDDGDDTLYGGEGDDTLYGEEGNDIIYGGAGNDSLYGSYGADILHGGEGDDYLQGAGQDDIYYYTAGKDIIYDNGGTAGDEIYLAEEYTSGSVSYFKIGTDMQIYFDPNNYITIKSFFSSTTYRVETLYFDGGPAVDLTTVTTVAQGDDGNNSISGSSGNDVIYGYGGDDTLNGNAGHDSLYGGLGNDTLNGGAGNDYLDGGAGNDVMNGGADNDTYYYLSGSDTITDTGGTDTLELASGFTEEDLFFRRDASSTVNARDLFIDLGGSNHIRIDNFFYSTSNQIEEIRFADNSTFVLTGFRAVTYGTSGDESINGVTLAGFRDDLIYALDGNDYVSAGEGNDTVYGGNGNDTLGGGNGDDVLYGEGGNDTLTGFNGNDALYGGGGDDYLQGGAGANVLDGGAGNDTLLGSTGNDTYYYSSGMDFIQEQYGSLNSFDTLILTGNTTINDISTSRDGHDANIVINAGVDEIYLDYHHYNSYFAIEIIQFSDGFSASLTTHQSWMWGTGGVDTLTGTAAADTIIGKDNDDTLYGLGGADAIHGGEGDDVIYGGDGSDLLHGGVGDDILYGDAGADTIFGGDGADTFRFMADTSYTDVDIIKDFSVSQSDVIDIANLLDGIYDPMTDMLDDFVQFGQSGGDTTVSIDRDGASNGYGWTQIALLEGVLHTDPEALVTSGNLLVT